jgi:hypothetical protein
MGEKGKKPNKTGDFSAVDAILKKVANSPMISIALLVGPLPGDTIAHACQETVLGGPFRIGVPIAG